ncbi:MAG: hypothetical protein HQL96_01725 [Magnetococcales bacterium]|nr:hypothetical protein [Magnetococcales bacterium]
MGEHSDQELDALHRLTAEWIGAFSHSQHFAGLTSRQKRVCKRIITLFVEAMYAHHDRLPQRWTARTVEACCLETLPESGTLKPPQLLALPPVLTAFFGCLAETGRIRNGAVLIRALGRLEEKFARHPRNDEIAAPGTAFWEPFAPGSRVTERQLRQFAARIAGEIARDRPALISRAVMGVFEQRPVLIFDLLRLLREQFASSEGRSDDYLISAYFILLSHSLQNIRFGMERHFDWAREIFVEFQNAVVAQAREENFAPQLLVGILEALAEAKLEITQELLDVYEYQITHFAPEGELPTRGQIDAMFESLVDEHGGDPFAIGDTLAQMIRALPLDAQSALIGEFASSALPGMKDAVVSLCLHPEEQVRHEALQWLLHNARLLTPTALRRLIVIRNWLPEKGRRSLDTLIKTARIKGVECASRPEGAPVRILRASQVDGVGAQSLMLSIHQQNRQARIGSVLLKQNIGLADAWITPPLAAKEVTRTLRHAARREYFLDVSEEYLDVAIRHNIAVGLEKGIPPSSGLLQLAEAIGVAEWMPRRLEGSELAAGILAEYGGVDPESAEEMVRTSGVWGEIPGIASSWFEESQEITLFLEQCAGAEPLELVERVLERYCEPNRASWAERFAWTAYWFHMQSARVRERVELDRHFAVLALELYRGRPLAEVPVMRGIAFRTITGESGGVD